MLSLALRLVFSVADNNSIHYNFSSNCPRCLHISITLYVCTQYSLMHSGVFENPPTTAMSSTEKNISADTRERMHDQFPPVLYTCCTRTVYRVSMSNSVLKRRPIHGVMTLF